MVRAPEKFGNHCVSISVVIRSNTKEEEPSSMFSTDYEKSDDALFYEIGSN